MNKQDTVKLIAKIKALYPNYLNGAENSTLQTVVNVAYSRLAEYPPELIDEALTNYALAGNKFAPNALQLAAELENAVEKAAKGWIIGENQPTTPAIQDYVYSKLQKDVIFRAAMEFAKTGKIAEPIGFNRVCNGD